MSIPVTMRASRLLAAKTLVVEEVPTPALESTDVLVLVAAVGLCGSDVHFYDHGRVGDLVVEQPLTLGHEASGTIVAVGADVRTSRIGERVAIEPQRHCRFCDYCRTGRYNLCARMRFASAPPVDGAFSEFIAVPTDFAHPIPDTMSFDAAAMAEPLSVAIAAVRKAGVVPGGSVLITGAGPIGIAAVQAARAYGATDIIVSDPLPRRRAAAATYGATETLDPVSDERLPEESVDAFIDASGASGAIVDGLRRLRRGGTAVLVGMGAEEFPLDLFLLQSRELQVVGLFRYVDTWPTAIALIATGSVDVESMVTAGFDLDHVDEAMRRNKDDDVMKLVIRP